MADARHVGDKHLAMLHVQLNGMVEVGKDCLVAGGIVGSAEDGDHLEILANEVFT